MSLRALIAGVGNIFLGDDAFGCEVARLLEQDNLPPGVHARDYGIGGLHLAYEIADGVDTLILIDTIPGDGQPGEVVILQADLADLAALVLDAHGMDPASVLTTVRNLGVEPPRTLVVGCRPASTSEGIGLSSAVAAAVEPARRAVLQLLDHELGSELETKEC